MRAGPGGKKLRGGLEETGLEMSLLDIFLVEPIMINRNRACVEQVLEVSIAVLWIEQVLLE